MRSEARQIAAAFDRRSIIIDGPPGIGCSVIALRYREQDSGSCCHRAHIVRGA
ncbi:MAG: hypothetical protein MZV70_33545 [Desulfobacterales bacterium]|nr:hypothetical protein [Desulfobacterales bacterium]